MRYCFMDWEELAEFEIYSEGYDPTLSCSKHLGEMMSDDEVHYIYHVAMEDNNAGNYPS